MQLINLLISRNNFGVTNRNKLQNAQQTQQVAYDEGG